MGETLEAWPQSVSQWGYSTSSQAVPSTQEKLCPEAAVLPRAKKREMTGTVWGVSKSKKPLRAKHARERVLCPQGPEFSFRNSKK